MSPRIFVALSTFSKDNPKPLQVLQESGFRVEYNKTGERLKKQQVIDFLAGFNGVIAGLEPYDADVLSALPDLKCISRCGVGIDNIDLDYAITRGIAVLSTPDAVIQPVAELTLGMIFDLMRKLTIHTELMRQHKWERQTGHQIAGKTIGVIGLGRIGQRVAELLTRLDCRVIGFDLRPDQAWAKKNAVGLVSFQELLSRSDVITIHITAQLDHPFVLGKEEFLLMKKGASIVNTSRGSCIDEQALCDALKEGHLGAAALDVFKEEPYQGPLCELLNVVLTPHCATLTHESRLDMEIQAVQNVIKYFS